MLKTDEFYSGQVMLNDDFSISVGKLSFPAESILDICYCEGSHVTYGIIHDLSDSLESPVSVALRLNRKVSQPGMTYKASSTNNLLLRFSDKSSAEKLLSALRSKIDSDTVREDHFSLSTDCPLPFNSSIVEAKKNEDGYVRAGTKGSRPYASPTASAPIVDVSLDLLNSKVFVSYTEMSATDRDSLWFKFHPEDTFDLSKATGVSFTLKLRNSSVEVSATFVREDIEKDIRATGLSSISFYYDCINICDAVRWINSFKYYLSLADSDQARKNMEPQSENEDEIAEVPEENTRPIKVELESALSLLYSENIITEREYKILSARIKP